MTELSWTTAADWDAAQSENKVVHEGYGDRQADQVALGYSDRWLPPGMVSFYPLDENAGASTAVDAIGPNDMSTLGSPTFGNPGIFGTDEPDFDGNDDGLLAPDDTSLHVTNISAWAWFRTSSSGDYANVMTLPQASAGNPPLLMRKTNNDYFEAYIGDADSASTSVITNNTVNDGNRHFVGVVYDGSSLELYLDPTDTTPSVSTSTSVNVGQPDGFSIGFWHRDNGNIQFFNGRIDEVGLADAAFSGQQMLDLSDAPVSGSLTTGKKTS